MGAALPFTGRSRRSPGCRGEGETEAAGVRRARRAEPCLTDKWGQLGRGCPATAPPVPSQDVPGSPSRAGRNQRFQDSGVLKALKPGPPNRNHSPAQLTGPGDPMTPLNILAGDGVGVTKQTFPTWRGSRSQRPDDESRGSQPPGPHACPLAVGVDRRPPKEPSGGDLLPAAVCVSGTQAPTAPAPLPGGRDPVCPHPSGSWSLLCPSCAHC